MLQKTLIENFNIIKENNITLYQDLKRLAYSVCHEEEIDSNIRKLKPSFKYLYIAFCVFGLCCSSAITGLYGAVTSFAPLQPAADDTITPKILSGIMISIAIIFALIGFNNKRVDDNKRAVKKGEEYLVNALGSWLYKGNIIPQHTTIILLLNRCLTIFDRVSGREKGVRPMLRSQARLESEFPALLDHSMITDLTEEQFTKLLNYFVITLNEFQYRHPTWKLSEDIDALSALQNSLQGLIVINVEREIAKKLTDFSSQHSHKEFRHSSDFLQNEGFPPYVPGSVSFDEENPNLNDSSLFTDLRSEKGKQESLIVDDTKSDTNTNCNETNTLITPEIDDIELAEDPSCQSNIIEDKALISKSYILKNPNYHSPFYKLGLKTNKSQAYNLTLAFLGPLASSAGLCFFIGQKIISYYAPISVDKITSDPRSIAAITATGLLFATSVAFCQHRVTKDKANKRAIVHDVKNYYNNKHDSNYIRDQIIDLLKHLNKNLENQLRLFEYRKNYRTNLFNRTATTSTNSKNPDIQPRIPGQITTS